MTSPFAAAVPGWILGGLVYALVGSVLVWLALAVALRFFRPAWPRGRYWLTVAAFAAAAVLPLFAYQGEIERALDNPPPMLRLQGEPGAVLELTPEKERQAWVRFYLSSWPARDYAKLWLLGVALLGLRGVVSSLRLAWLRRHWRPASPELLARLEWPTNRRLRVAPTGIPLASGVIRPVVFMPAWLLESMAPAALRSIARHELAHIRWRDPLADSAVRAVRTLLWPALGLWAIERLIRREREAACDLEAVASLQADDRTAYVETLAEVAARCRKLATGVAGPAPAAALGAIRTGELEDRARRLLIPAPASRRWQTAAAVLAVAWAATAIHAVPFPDWLRAPTDETAIWGPLDHLLGFNPAIHAEMTPEGPRVIVQGHELDAEAAARWYDPQSSLSELAAAVLEAEAEARRASRSP